ncbi:MAG: hypothetical protein ACK401_02970 [Archaeoglobaceae archaeon]
MELEKLLKGFERAIVSLSTQEYPISFPSSQFKVEKNKIVFPKPRGLQIDITAEKGESLEFEPKRFYEFKQGGIFERA